MLNALASRQAAAGGFEPGQVTQACGKPVRLEPRDIEPRRGPGSSAATPTPVSPAAPEVIVLGG